MMNEHCEDCGREMHLTHIGSYHEPSEYECPVYEGGVDEIEADTYDEPDIEWARERREMEDAEYAWAEPDPDLVTEVGW